MIRPFGLQTKNHIKIVVKLIIIISKIIIFIITYSLEKNVQSSIQVSHKKFPLFKMPQVNLKLRAIGEELILNSYWLWHPRVLPFVNYSALAWNNWLFWWLIIKLQFVTKTLVTLPALDTSNFIYLRRALTPQWQRAECNLPVTIVYSVDNFY